MHAAIEPICYCKVTFASPPHTTASTLDNNESSISSYIYQAQVLVLKVLAAAAAHWQTIDGSIQLALLEAAQEMF